MSFDPKADTSWMLKVSIYDNGNGYYAEHQTLMDLIEYAHKCLNEGKSLNGLVVVSEWGGEILWEKV